MSELPSGDAPTLSVKGGPLDGHVLPLDRSIETVLGSGPDCHLRIELANVEADHAHVLWDERGVHVSDFGTSAGTFVNGEQIATDYRLSDGDRLCLGPPGSQDSARLVVHVPSDVGPAEEQGLVLDTEPQPLVLEASPIMETPAMIEPEAIEAPAVIEAEPEAPAVIMDVPPGEPEPEAEAPAAAPAPPAAPPKPPPPAPKKPPRPDYMTDIPSMVPIEGEGEGVSVPAAPSPPRAMPAAPPKKAAPGPPRLVLIGAGTAILAVAGFLGLRSFHKPPPVLLSILPPMAEAGQTATMSGTGFDPDAAGNKVRFGEQAGQVLSASEAQLAVKVPDVKVTSGSANVQVMVESRGKKSNSLFFKVRAVPALARLEPDVAMPGDEVVASGKNLAGKPLSVSVSALTAEVVEEKPGALRFRVPLLAEPQGKTVPVVVQVGTEASKPASLLLGRLPLVIEAAPPRGQPGERVVLKGRGFDPSPEGNVVTFAGQTALVFTASATELTVSAPSVGMDVQTPAKVVVQAQGRTSSSECVFTLTRPSSTAYTPRYFPAPVPDHPSHDHAFVSTELGPALLLTGKSEAASTAERAARVAAALNALVETAMGGKEVALEARDKPAPAVAIAAVPEPLVSVTAADAAGYDEPWDPSLKAPKGRLQPQGVAAYWAALLDDQIKLFARHQRPSRLLELSPRGKVLADIYAESVRREGAGAAVPVGVVNPLSPRMAKALREMALLIPAEGQGKPAAAVEGLWRGTLEETSAGTREIELRLRLEGGRLTGALTTKSGGLAMDTPLREATYDRGTIRFSVVMRGAPMHFEGTVQQDSMTGVLHPSAGSRDVVGRFSLNFIG